MTDEDVPPGVQPSHTFINDPLLTSDFLDDKSYSYQDENTGSANNENSFTHLPQVSDNSKSYHKNEKKRSHNTAFNEDVHELEKIDTDKVVPYKKKKNRCIT